MLSGGQFVFLSGVLTFGVPLALAVHELIALRRPGRGAWGGDEPAEPKPLPPLPSAPKQLPDCLIPQLPPRPAVARDRVPELV